MPGGGEVEFGVVDNGVFPPVEFDDVVDAFGFKKRFVAQGDDEDGFEVFVKEGEGVEVEMVVMVMRDDDDVDVGQVVNGESRRTPPFGADELEGTGSVRPDGVGEDVDALESDEMGGVVDDGAFPFSGAYGGGEFGGVGVTTDDGDAFLPSGEPPFGYFTGGGLVAFVGVEVEEPFSVKMVGDRAVPFSGAADVGCEQFVDGAQDGASPHDVRRRSFDALDGGCFSRFCCVLFLRGSHEVL